MDKVNLQHTIEIDDDVLHWLAYGKGVVMVPPAHLEEIKRQVEEYKCRYERPGNRLKRWLGCHCRQFYAWLIER